MYSYINLYKVHNGFYIFNFNLSIFYICIDIITNFSSFINIFSYTFIITSVSLIFLIYTIYNINIIFFLLSIFKTGAK